MDDLHKESRAVGIKECQKLVKNDGAKKAYIAQDAAPHVIEPFLALCQEHGVPVEVANNMEALGKACGIEVGAAVAVIKK